MGSPLPWAGGAGAGAARRGSAGVRSSPRSPHRRDPRRETRLWRGHPAAVRAAHRRGPRVSDSEARRSPGHRLSALIAHRRAAQRRVSQTSRLTPRPGGSAQPMCSRGPCPCAVGGPGRRTPAPSGEPERTPGETRLGSGPRHCTSLGPGFDQLRTPGATRSGPSRHLVCLVGRGPAPLPCDHERRFSPTLSSSPGPGVLGIVAPHSWLACAGAKGHFASSPGRGSGKGGEPVAGQQRRGVQQDQLSNGEAPCLPEGPAPRNSSGGGRRRAIMDAFSGCEGGIHWAAVGGQVGWVGVGWNSPGVNKRERGSGSQR